MCKVTVTGKVCRKVITYNNGNTSNMMNHIFNKHNKTDAGKELKKILMKRGRWKK